MILFRDDAVLKHAYMQSGAPLKKARRSGSAGQNALIGRLMMMITSTEGNWPQSLETVSYCYGVYNRNLVLKSLNKRMKAASWWSRVCVKFIGCCLRRAWWPSSRVQQQAGCCYGGYKIGKMRRMPHVRMYCRRQGHRLEQVPPAVNRFCLHLPRSHASTALAPPRFKTPPALEQSKLPSAAWCPARVPERVFHI